MTRSELYDALVRLCQDFGFTCDATYDHLNDAIDSIRTEPDEPEPMDMSGPSNPTGEGR